MSRKKPNPEHIQWLREKRQEWNAQHPDDPINVGGRPSYEDNVWAVCEALWPEGTTRRTTLGKFLQVVETELAKQWSTPTQKKTLAPNTISKHVMRWIRCTKTLDEVPKDIILRHPDRKRAVLLLDKILQHREPILAFRKAVEAALAHPPKIKTPKN